MTNPLPPQDPHAPDEKLPGEAELAALYRQLPQNEPGPALDAAVLRAAAQALAPDEESATEPRERRRAARKLGDWAHPKNPAPSTPAAPPAAGNRRRPRWLIALGSAATLVLAAGLAWHMRGMPLPESASPSTSGVAPTEVSAAAPAPRAAPPAAAMPSAEPMPPPEPPRQSPPRMVMAQTHMPTAMASRKAAADKSAQRASSEGYATGRLAPPAQPAPAAPPTVLQESVSDSAARTAKPAMAEVALSAADTPAAMAAAPAQAPATITADMTTAPNASDTPAQELDKIRQLLSQHHDDEARQRLTAFQRAHPHWQLPPELRAQLRQP